jgi:hypothetical protein
VLPDLPISPIHSLTSFIEYLSVCVCVCVVSTTIESISSQLNSWKIIGLKKTYRQPPPEETKLQARLDE